MRHDAIVIGGSFAGLSAATYIARGRRTVAVIDAGAPRNRFAAHSHGFLGHDGADPRALLAEARRQVAAYAEASFVEGRAMDACATAAGFAVTLRDGTRLEAAKLVLAFGLSDCLPDLPGLAARWGRTVLHCPYCHGYGFSGRPLGVLSTGAHSVHQAMLIAEWGPTTLFLNGGPLPDDATRDALARRGVAIEPRSVVSLQGEPDAPVTILFEGGARLCVAALYIAAPTRFNSDLADRLGCEIRTGPLGPVISTDESRMTSVPGVYAAGDIARAPHAVVWAASDGATAGMAVHRALVFG